MRLKPWAEAPADPGASWASKAVLWTLRAGPGRGKRAPRRRPSRCGEAERGCPQPSPGPDNGETTDTSEDVSSLRGGCSATQRRWALTSSSSLSS